MQIRPNRPNLNKIKSGGDAHEKQGGRNFYQAPEEQEENQENGQEAAPLVNSSPIVSSEILHQEIAKDSDIDFKRHFLEKLKHHLDYQNLKKAINFISDEDWEVRFELAKILQHVLLHANPNDEALKNLALAGIKEMEQDSDSMVRFIVADTSKKLKR